MERLGAAEGRPHLFAALVALGLALAFLCGGRALAIHRERHNIAALAPEVFPLKTQGLVLQRAAAQAPDVLPLYGSSEMMGPKGWRASDFFRTAPTGFQVSAVGKPGATSLIILQKLGALDRELRGKKVAISLSSVWFISSPSPYYYNGNFSRFAATHLVFNGELDLALKREIAARMLQFPRSLERAPLLEFALRRVASGDWFNQILFYAIWPLGRVEAAILDLQDHFAVLSDLPARQKRPLPHLQEPDWPALIATAEQTASANRAKSRPIETHKPAAGAAKRDERFSASLNTSPEWTDLELLLRVLQETGARPLLISMPMNGPYFNALNISRMARQQFYDRLHQLAQRFNVELVDFESHDEDPRFLNPHLTAKGWVFFDRAIDDFMHDRVPRS